MATINLRDYYPFYHHDVFVEVSDDLLFKSIAHGLCALKTILTKMHIRGDKPV